MTNNIVFAPGCHGNFLERILNFAAGKCDIFDIFDKDGASHNISYDYDIHKIFLSNHNYLESNNSIFISVDINDMYYHTYHTYKAAGNFGFDFLSCNSTEIFDFVKNNNHSLVKSSELIGFIDSLPTNTLGVKQFLKYHFNPKTNYIFLLKNIILKKFQPKYIFPFNAFYEHDLFMYHVNRCLEVHNLKYVVDISPIHKNFLLKRKAIIDSKKEVEEVFYNNSNINLNLYQSAYLEFISSKNNIQQ